MGQVAFTAYFEVVPGRGMQRNPVRTPGKNEGRGRRSSKWDTRRSLDQLSVQAYNALLEAPGLCIATPGGGQSQQFGRFSDFANGLGVAPQFGESPNRFMIEGFTNMSGVTTETPNTNTTIFHGNEVLSGDLGNQPWLKNPKAVVSSEVSILKQTLEDAVAGVIDDTGSAIKVFRIVYKNITWGDRGQHFPQ